MATRTKKKDEGMLAAGLGAAALAAAAAGAGYYFYASKDAKKHRAAASRWATGLKREVVKRAKVLKKINAKSIADAVDEAVGLYEGVRGVSATELRAAAKELKKNWQKVKGELETTTRKSAGRAAGTAKRAVRRTVAKTTAKATITRKRRI